MNGEHHYSVHVIWTGNRGTGTTGYKDYDRDHIVSIDNKPDILGSSDAAFRGNIQRHNPEDMLVASLSTCHMLWYLHLCADAGIVVTDYSDNATGILKEMPEGGRFTEVTLRPRVTITNEELNAKANELHNLAHKKCFIANSVSFPVKYEPVCIVK